MNGLIRHSLYRHVAVGGYIRIIGFMVIMAIIIPTNDFSDGASMKFGARLRVLYFRVTRHLFSPPADSEHPEFLRLHFK